jgi:hypothetical protein
MTTTTLRVGLIGTGRISDLHAIEYLQNPGARIVALCDRNVVQAREKAASWGIPDVAVDDDIDTFLARPDLDPLAAPPAPAGRAQGHGGGQDPFPAKADVPEPDGGRSACRSGRGA